MGDASSPVSAASLSSPPTPQPSGLPSTNPTPSFWQTSHPTPLAHHRSTVSLPSRASVVVVGTGISGTFAVDELLRRHYPQHQPRGSSSSTQASGEHGGDVNVLVLEARTLCSAATGRNGGHLQPLIHAAPKDIIDFEVRNFRHVESLIEKGRGVDCDFRRVEGCLGFWNETYFEEAKKGLREMAAASEDEHSSALPAAAAGLDDLVRVVEKPDELARLALKGGVKGAIVQSLAASLSPYKLVVTIWERLLEDFEVSLPPREKGKGGKGKQTLNLQTDTPVLAITRETDGDRGWTLQTRRGNVHAPTVILATNAYTSHPLPAPFAHLIVPVQAQMSALLPPAHSKYREDLIPMSYGFMGVGDMDREMSDYLVQNPVRPKDHPQGGGGHLMFGGGRQNALAHGVGVWHDDFVDTHVERYLRGLDQRLDLAAPPHEGQGQRQRQGQGQRQRQGQGQGYPDGQIGAQRLDIAATWTGIMGSSADGHPWVGPVPDVPGVSTAGGRGDSGLFVCAGYSGHGMTNAPLCGRFVARLAAGRQSHAERMEGVDLDVDVQVPEAYLITRERIERVLGRSI